MRTICYTLRLNSEFREFKVVRHKHFILKIHVTLLALQQLRCKFYHTRLGSSIHSAHHFGRSNGKYNKLKFMKSLTDGKFRSP